MGFVLRVAVRAALASVAALGGDSSMDRATLRGIKALKIIVEYPKPEFNAEGVTVAAARQQIEQKLHAAGIAVNPEANDFLGLTLTSLRTKRPPFAIFLDLGVYQVAVLGRDKTTKTVAETWSVPNLALLQPKGVFDQFQVVLDGMLEQFVSAWKSVNAAAAK